MADCEKKIITQLSRGSEAAFEVVYYRYYNNMYHFALKFLNDRELAREVVQDVFLSIWKNRYQIQSDKPILPLLLTSTKNLCINLLKHDKVKKEYIEVLATAYQVDDYNGIDSLVYSEMDEKINRTLGLLPQRCKEVFILSRENGLKYKEIAKRLNISVKTVETQISKALKIFKVQMKDYM